MGGDARCKPYRKRDWSVLFLAARSRIEADHPQRYSDRNNCRGIDRHRRTDDEYRGGSNRSRALVKSNARRQMRKILRLDGPMGRLRYGLEVINVEAELDTSVLLKFRITIRMVSVTPLKFVQWKVVATPVFSAPPLSATPGTR
jgi:hypothetical protein